MFDHHYEMLVASGISDEYITARNYQSIRWDSSTDPKDLSERRILQQEGFGGGQIPLKPEKEYTGLLIPVYSPTGKRVMVQWRPDFTFDSGKGKYLHPSGVTNHLDVHPLSVARVQDTAQPLVITEGVKKGDCLASRGYAAIALSGVWNWRSKSKPVKDWENVPLKGRKVYIIFDSDGASNRNVNFAATALEAFLKEQEADVVVRFVPEKFGDTDTKGLDDYIVAGGTFDEIIERGEKPIQLDKFYFDHSHMAELMVREVLEGRFCYARGAGWLQYTGKFWERCGEELATEVVRQFMADKAEKAGMLAIRTGNAVDEKIWKSWRSLLSGNSLGQILKLCRGIPPIYQRFDAFDINLDELNCQNGMLDLRTGELHQHHYSQLVTKITGAEYEPGYTHPSWDQALEAIPEDIRDWAQFRYGQALTGYAPPDDTAVIEHGGGSNGKSTIVDGFAAALGSTATGYYRLVSNKIILQEMHEGVGTEFMDLKGLRFAQLEETPEARKLDVNKVKQTVGTTQVTARHMRQDFTTFDVTHSMFITTNNVPVVNATDDGSWRRLILMKYPYTFRSRPELVKGPNDRLGDPTLKMRIKQDKDVHKAVLSWMVAGAVRFYENNRIMLPHPPRIQQDTDNWRNSSDLVMRFVDEKLVFEEGQAVTTKDMYDVLCGWLEATGHRKWSLEVMVGKFENHHLFEGAECKKRRLHKNKITSRPFNRGDIESKQIMGFDNVRFRRKDEVHTDVETDTPALSVVR